MAVMSMTLTLETAGNTDIQEITGQLAASIQESGLSNGAAVVFCPSSTSALTTIEYESGCVEDLKGYFERVIPSGAEYRHNLRWGDGNGFSHLRAAVLGPSLSIPFRDGRMTLGTWQQVILVDFDNRPRRRELVVQLIGE
jgi:secondary thiamine-phosphate synthase enzyme